VCFSYIGGKSKIGKWVQEYIPNDIEIYVEPFGGAFWVFYCLEHDKYKNLTKVVYNDFNDLNSNLHLCIKNYKKFHRYIKDIPTQNGKRFIKYQEDAYNSNFHFSDIPDYKKGLEHVYVVTQVFSGSRPETSSFVDLKGKYSDKFSAFRNKLSNPKWTSMFDKITDVECLECEEVIEKYDSETAFFYLDPPYYKTEHYYSMNVFDIDDHERLSNILKNIKGRFALSYYYFDDLEKFYPRDKFRWEEKGFIKSSSARPGSKQDKGMELLIMNY